MDRLWRFLDGPFMRELTRAAGLFLVLSLAALLGVGSVRLALEVLLWLQGG